jgi:hypothetical protein
VAIIPNVAGEVVLPEIRIPWWNTEADEARVAVLPARTVTVLPAPVATVPEPASVQAPVTRSSPAAATVPSSAAPSSRFWQWISALLLLLWVLTGLGWWRERRGVGSAIAFTRGPPASLANARRALHRACRANDSQRAALALMHWSLAVWPEDPPRSLGAIARRFDGDGIPLRELDRTLYGSNPADWQGGTALWDMIRQGPRAEADALPGEAADLPPLYPYHR